MMFLFSLNGLGLLLGKEAAVEVVCDDVAGEGNGCNAEAGEHFGEHLLPREDGMFAPCVAFRPRIAVKVWPSHFDLIKRTKDETDVERAGKGEVYEPV